ncbi:DUF4227 family protein [Paenibacillus sp. YYML68]|uniref:DUF4227 family protein n=1 Tax=Paenibacillus sp. YYML68 TaxID=2909250 RepID=UPI0024914B49|nr:DUF4227 family protein [Paenibacillus sp. YYML68]
MIFHIRIGRWLQRARFAVLFIVFTFALYQLLLFVTPFLNPMSKYKEPEGRAVKVFQNETAVAGQSQAMGERLKLFYWIGE